MKYNNIFKGVFLSRPNRFIAHVEIDSKIEICHVKNTGRCKELLVKGNTVYCVKSDNPARKTQFDLVAVEKGEKLINMDSQAPNLVVKEAIKDLFCDVKLIKPEYKYKTSRIDFYIETELKKYLLEVKGVTLEQNGVVLFPDAPTERGIKHLNELAVATQEGYSSCVLFLVQMNNVKYFTPNTETHLQFSEALKSAQSAGVEIMAYDTIVTPQSMVINKPVKIIL